jgi:hypothetical protein
MDTAVKANVNSRKLNSAVVAGPDVLCGPEDDERRERHERDPEDRDSESRSEHLPEVTEPRHRLTVELCPEHAPEVPEQEYLRDQDHAKEAEERPEHDSLERESTDGRHRGVAAEGSHQ